MIRILGELATIALFVIAIWAMIKYRPRSPLQSPPVTYIRCLSFQHPINLTGTVSESYVREWYQRNSVLDELELVSRAGTEAEMRYYMDTVAPWRKAGLVD